VVDESGVCSSRLPCDSRNSKDDGFIIEKFAVVSTLSVHDVP
jgi:hypothetical protein